MEIKLEQTAKELIHRQKKSPQTTLITVLGSSEKSVEFTIFKGTGSYSKWS